MASAFLALVGVSLALAHRDRLNLPAFWRRLAIVAGAAALVTAGSSSSRPARVIWFGILHCIAAASLLALPLVRAPAWASLSAGAAAIALPFFFHSSLFDPPALLWLGLGEALPNTLDWRPLLPWAGVVLLGLGAARLPGVLDRLTSPWRWRAKSAPARVLCFAGRHSLAVYLLHQPILIGLVAAVAASGLVATIPPPKPDYGAFLVGLRTGLRIARGPADDCALELPMRRRRQSNAPATPAGSASSTPSARPSSSAWPTPAWAGSRSMMRYEHRRHCEERSEEATHATAAGLHHGLLRFARNDGVCADLKSSRSRQRWPRSSLCR